jgi:hypothetical protein
MYNPFTAKNKAKIFSYLKENWQLLCFYAGGLAAFLGLYIYRLSSLTGQHGSIFEKRFLETASSWHTIFHFPLYAPYSITVRLLHYVHGGLLVSRLASVLWAFVAVCLFFIIVRRLHGIIVAALGTVLFASAAWVLHVGRFVAPDVVLLSAGLVLLFIFLRKKTRTSSDAQKEAVGQPLWLMALLIITGVYLPGFIWFVALAIILRRDVLLGAWKKAKLVHRTVTVLIAVLLAIPLIHAGISTPKVFIQNWLALNIHVPNAHELLTRIIRIPDNLFWHGPNVPVLWLGKLPMIELVTTVFALIGAYYYIKRFSQTKLVVVIPAIAWLLTIAGGTSLITLIVAFVYLYAAGGIAYSLKLWQRVFPRNPIARGTAVGLIAAVLALVVLYNVRQYFVAWAYNSQTRAAYQQKL